MLSSAEFEHLKNSIGIESLQNIHSDEDSSVSNIFENSYERTEVWQYIKPLHFLGKDIPAQILC